MAHRKIKSLVSSEAKCNPCLQHQSRKKALVQPSKAGLNALAPGLKQLWSPSLTRRKPQSVALSAVKRFLNNTHPAQA